MSIFFPDNDLRQARLVELSADAQYSLQLAKAGFAEFKTLAATINQAIALLYQRSGLSPPATTNLDILRASGAAGMVGGADAVVEIANVVLGVGAFAASVAWLAPG